MTQHHFPAPRTPYPVRPQPATPFTPLPRLTLRLKHRPDANALLVLVREDGSSTSGEIGPPQGYGPVHDLAHYVVEQALGLSEGFLGLVAAGWAIRDFEVKGTARRLPDEAALAECAAGELSRQEMMGQYSTAEEFAWALGMAMAQMERPGAPVPAISEDAFAAMRDELAALRERWLAVRPGAMLELEFACARRLT